MVAKQKLVPGDVIMVDTAYSTSLFEDYYKSHCNQCFIRIKEEPVNCPTCDMVSSPFENLKTIECYFLKSPFLY